jgi:hypothetical protein
MRRIERKDIGDINYPLEPVSYWMGKLVHTWNSSFPGGATHGQAPSLLLYQGIPALLSLLGLSLPRAQAVFYTIWLGLAAGGFAFFAEQLRRRFGFGFTFTVVGVTLYQFNVYRMIMFGDGAHMASYAALPIVLGLLFLATERRSLGWAAAAGAAMTLAAPAGPNPPMYAVFGTVIALIVSYLTVTASDRRAALARLGVFSISFLATNAFWLLPFVSGQLGAFAGPGLADNNLANWVDSVSGNSTWYNILRLQGAWDWYAGFDGHPYVAYANQYQTNPFLVGWALAFPAMALLALTVRRPGWGIRLLVAALGTLGFFLAMGTHEPMLRLFRWLIAHVPFFWMFRSPWYKFGLWQSVAMVILSAVTLDVAVNWLKQRALGRWLVPILGIGFVVAAAGSVDPLVTGAKFPPSSSLTIPPALAENARAIERLVGTGELVLLPDVPAFNYRWHWSGLIDPLFYTTRARLLYTSEQIGTTATNPTRGLLYDAFTHALNDPADVGGAREILAWLGSQGVLQRDDINQEFYGRNFQTPAFVRERLTAIGLTDPDPSVRSPWALYRTGLDQQPVKLATTAVYTPEHPRAVLGPFAELGRLTPTTQFLTNEADRTAARTAGIPVTNLFGVDLEQPETFDDQPRFDYRVLPGTYRLFAKQPGSEPPALQLLNRPAISFTALDHGWWQSNPVSLDGELERLVTTSFERTTEHARQFDAPSAWVNEDVNDQASGEPNFRTERDPDEQNGLRLSASAHKLMEKSELIDLAPGRLYELSFDYKTSPGAPGEYSVHLAGVERTALSEGLVPTADWRTVQAAFRVTPGTTHAYVNLFSFTPQVGTPATHWYRNVSVRELTAIEQLIVLAEPEADPLAPAGPLTSAVSPTSVTTELPARSTASILSFDQLRSRRWRLTGVPTAEPITTNWYANGWILPAGPAATIVIRYTVQQWFVVGLIVSGLSLTGGLWWFTRHRRQPSR